MSSAEKNVWQVTATPRPAGNPPDQEIACDVAIVGAGFTGLRAALALAESGAKVAVFDTHDVGHGASGRNGGQVNPMLPVAVPEELRRAVGDTYFERLARVSLGSADELFALVNRYGIDCDARQHGWIRANHSTKAAEKTSATVKLWNDFGAGFRFLDRVETQRLTGIKGYASATLSPKGGAVQPLSLARGLAAAAESAGARIYARSAVRDLQRIDQRWVMTVAGQRVQADRVLLSTNGYTDGLFRGLKGSILPMTPIQIATDPLQEEEIESILPGGQTLSDTRRLLLYTRREPDRRLVFGGIGYGKLFGGINGFNWLLKDAARVFPMIASDRWRYRWGGQIALTADHIPHLHEPAPGLLAGLGYNGRGVAMSMVMGRLLAERALGADPASLPFPMTPIRPLAWRRIQNLGASTMMHLFRLYDRWESR